MSLSMQPDANPVSLASWAEIVRALPNPAALVDTQGCVIVPGRWIDHEAGTPLVDVDDDGVSPLKPVSVGADGASRWRVRQVGEHKGVYLATVERFDADDHALRRLYAAADKLFVIYDQDGHMIQWNAAWKELLGYSDEDLIGLDTWTLLPADDLKKRPAVMNELRTCARSEPSWRMRSADGTYRMIQWVLLYDPTRGRYVGVGTDVSEERRRSAELQRRAYTDDLTGLASRSHTVAAVGRHLLSDRTPALLFCDLDQFKVVNDSLGHSVGDRLLAALGERLSTKLDGPNITVGRLGGDEFAVVIGDGGLEAAKEAAEKVFETLSKEFVLDGRSIQVGVSIGICSADSGVITAETMFERADMAVYRAKETGRNRTVIYGPELQERVDRRFEIETALRRGLDLCEFEPWFQPIMDTPTGQIVGVEALLRWRRGGVEVLSPGAFHDIAMETGLITPIGRQMIHQALNEFSSMAGLGEGAWLTLNVSARELAHSDFTEWFIDQVGEAHLRPSQVVIEITESVAIEEHSLSDYLTVLRALGFRIALDDFGTGHSSLAHLRTLPIDMVKIDRSFVADLVDDHTTSALTRSIVDLCKALGLSVIFEGVETKAEAAAVLQTGGRWVQGFLYSKPLPVAELQWRTVGSELSRRLVERSQSTPER